ncbi:MAG: hypothetical protein PHU85_19660 [Phycisphaerae bacterium]|nr:hypothetical protein [Phycisphaerae bacterium]
MPVPATWPAAEFIIGNLPFLGSKLFRQNGLPDEYVQAMYAAYDLPKTSDLCCYWFELARRAIENSSPACGGGAASAAVGGKGRKKGTSSILFGTRFAGRKMEYFFVKYYI